MGGGHRFAPCVSSVCTMWLSTGASLLSYLHLPFAMLPALPQPDPQAASQTPKLSSLQFSGQLDGVLSSHCMQLSSIATPT